MFPSITFFFDVVFRKSPLPPPAHCQFGELLGKFFPFISRNVLFYLSHLCVCTLALWQLICNSRKWSSYMTLEITQHLCTKSRQKSQTPTCTSLMLKVPTRNSSTSTFLVCINVECRYFVAKIKIKQLEMTAAAGCNFWRSTNNQGIDIFIRLIRHTRTMTFHISSAHVCISLSSVSVERGAIYNTCSLLR